MADGDILGSGQNALLRIFAKKLKWFSKMVPCSHVEL